MGKAYERVAQSRKELTERLIKIIESDGQLPWEQGWHSVGQRPYNPVSTAVYKGTNRMRLMMGSYLSGYSDNRWVTFNQAKEHEWHIKKGEKGILCEKWIFEEQKIIEDPDTGEKKKEWVELDYPKVNFFILFNAEQVENMPEIQVEKKLEWDEQLELADKFVKSSVCPVKENPMETEAYYNPKLDEIHLPSRDCFISSGEFLATAIHEMGHSTGHISRLAREMSGIFGSKTYAREELVAELTAVFAQADLQINIGSKQFNNHAAYLQSWVYALRDDPNILFQASADAAKATDYLMEQYNQYMDIHKIVKTENQMEKKETYVVSFEKDGVCQARLVQARDADQAKQYFSSIEPKAIVYGSKIDEVDYAKRGMPLESVPDGWKPEYKDNTHSKRKSEEQRKKQEQKVEKSNGLER